MTLPHRQCAASLIFNEEGQVLLVRQNYGAYRWGAPGGIVDPGETPMQAARREAVEETGVQIKILRLVGLYLLQGGGWPDILAHVFEAQIVEGQPIIVNPEEIAECAWYSADATPEDMVHDIEAALEDVQAGRHGVVRTVLRKREMKAFTL
ncbi:NUDIX hydrolase [Deinococcus hopiensis]|uniref:ADP-ribose pyrophosphatase YjhB, NUDIX family n=1 Tax=Deinococcus hopiensis KR-140 TaxID=695939 RepID=A0A1W1VUJ3_9DEIO|nr:NUDIX hydrolase [Deinococcus hopiensis]SMB96996.1 ADP-ribose pyrophosphatase YjhB, NUDIX family [Deinococcus hopiensis KR-140]